MEDDIEDSIPHEQGAASPTKAAARAAAKRAAWEAKAAQTAGQARTDGGVAQATADVDAGLGIQAADADAEARRRVALRAQSFTELGASALPQASALFHVIQKFDEDDYGAADPRHVVPNEVLVGRTENEQREILRSKNAQHMQGILARLDTRRDADQQFGMESLPVQLVMGSVMSGPEGMLLGMGAGAALNAAKVGLLSANATRLARFGRGMAENAAGSAVFTGVQYAADPVMTAQDAWMNLAFDGLFGLGVDGLKYIGGRAYDAYTAPREVQDILPAVEGAVVGSGLRAADARERLGPDASPEEVQAAVTRSEVEDITSAVQRAEDNNSGVVRFMDDDATEGLFPSDDPKPNLVSGQTGTVVKPGGAAANDIPEVTVNMQGWASVSGERTPKIMQDKFEYTGDSAARAQMLGQTRLLVMNKHLGQSNGSMMPLKAPVTVVRDGQEMKILGLTPDLDKVIVEGKGKDGTPRQVQWRVTDLNEDLLYSGKPGTLENQNAVHALRFIAAGDALPVAGREARWNTLSAKELTEYRKANATTKGQILNRAFGGNSQKKYAEFNRQAGSGTYVGQGDVGPGARALSADEMAVVRTMAERFLPKGHRIVVRSVSGRANEAAGKLAEAGDGWGGSMGRIDGHEWLLSVNTDITDGRSADRIKTDLIHEVGHGILTSWINDVRLDPKVREGVKQLHAEYLANYSQIREGKTAKERLRRAVIERNGWSTEGFSDRAEGVADVPLTSAAFEATLYDAAERGVTMLARRHPGQPDISQREHAVSYYLNFSEFGAQQVVRYVEGSLAGATGWKPKDLPAAFKQWIKSLIEKFTDLFRFARENDLLAPDTRFQDFMENILAVNGRGAELRADEPVRSIPETVIDEYEPAMAAPTQPAQAGQSVRPTIQTFAQTDPLSLRYGLDQIPLGEAADRAEFKAIYSLYASADKYAPPRDTRKAVLNNAATAGAESAARIMHRSANPLVRMIASQLLETPDGFGGRRETAAIRKYMNERKILGNTVAQFGDQYAAYRQHHGGNVVGDYRNGELMRQFNRDVAIEIERRRAGQPGPVTNRGQEAVSRAANLIEEAYERARRMQVDAKTLGHKGLPDSSVGYMPHKLSGLAVRNMTNEQSRVLTSALVDQLVTTMGMDISTAANLAVKYVDIVKEQALAGNSVPYRVGDVGFADIAEKAAQAMNLRKEEVAKMIELLRKGPSYTRTRLNLDLLKDHPDGNGGTFKLLDMFETDQMSLLRNQAQRVSGEVALRPYNIMGKPGMDLVRRALKYGENDGKVTDRELSAFDQVAAEMLGQPFGTAGKGVWQQRIATTTSIVRLGGMGWTQIAESINLATVVGAAKAMKTIPGMVRLRNEAKALARGEKVNNPILSSIERASGVTFGTENRQFVFPMDNPDLDHQVYGGDALAIGDRLLRGGSHLQGKLSFWRAINGAQQRGAAEMIVADAMEAIRANRVPRNGLIGAGLTPGLIARLAKDINQIGKFDKAGRLIGFDATMGDRETMREFISVVHRGIGQAIQGNFVGERNAWSHDANMRLMTQFRTFSLTAVEKQWGRNVENHGYAVALGILMGSMSVAAPIYMARQVANAMGMEESKREEYLDKALSPYEISRATLNYVASAGLMGELLDVLVTTTGTGEALGARNAGGKTQGVIGNLVAPGLGVVDDAYRAIQNNKEGTDLSSALKLLPFSRLPVMIPIMNSLGD